MDRRPLGILLTVAFVLVIAAGAEAQGLQDRVRELETTVATQAAQIRDLQSSLNALNDRLVEHMRHEQTFITSVDCSAGEHIFDALNHRRARAAVAVYIEVTGACVEDVSIERDHVTLAGGSAGATIESPDGIPLFVAAKDVRLDNLTLRGTPNAMWVRYGHVEATRLRLIGGVTAIIGSNVRLFGPTVEGATEFGIDVRDESLFAISDCTVSGSGFAGVRVMESTFQAYNCTIRDSGWAGVRAEQGANVMFDFTTITSNEDGVFIGDSSIVRHNAGSLSIAGNRSAGIRCAASPAVPQLVGIAASEVTGNPGGDFVACAGH